MLVLLLSSMGGRRRKEEEEEGKGEGRRLLPEKLSCSYSGRREEGASSRGKIYDITFLHTTSCDTPLLHALGRLRQGEAPGGRQDGEEQTSKMSVWHLMPAYFLSHFTKSMAWQNKIEKGFLRGQC